MKDCFSSMNHLNQIIRFMNLTEINNLSLINKSLYSLLNPEINPNINSIYRDIAFKKYFNINNTKNFTINDENSLDDYKKTKNNWKNILEKLYINSKIYPNQEINEEIYKCFYTHYYMPYQRIENKETDYENNTLHQIICYDINKIDLITYNYYDKYFDANSENYVNMKIEPLRKGLLFENELINLKSVNKINSNKKITKMIINYSFEKLDNIYYSNIKKGKKKKKNKNNSIINFLLFLNHTFILFINLLYKYVSQFNNFQDSKKIINEYSRIHSNLINFGLLINEKFNNINITFNYLNKEQTGVKSQFKIYKMFLNIMEKNFYQKLKPLLNKNIEKILDLYFKENLDKSQKNNSFDSNNIETNNTEPIIEENEDEDLLNDSFNDIDNEDDEISEIEEDLTYKGIIEKYSNLILDFDINGDNVKFINHSKIKLNTHYNGYEKIILENFMKNIKNLINTNDDNVDIYQNNNTIFNEEVNTLNAILSFIKKLALQEEGVEEETIKLINRTKFNILKNCEMCIFNYLIKIINKKFIYELNNSNINDKNLLYKDNDLSFKNLFNIKNNVYDLYINKLGEIKKYLIDNNLNIIKNKTKEQAIGLINNYIDSNSDLLIKTCKEIVLFFIKQNCLYEHKNEIIIETLFKNQKISELKSFQNYCGK